MQITWPRCSAGREEGAKNWNVIVVAWENKYWGIWERLNHSCNVETQNHNLFGFRSRPVSKGKVRSFAPIQRWAKAGLVVYDLDHLRLGILRLLMEEESRKSFLLFRKKRCKYTVGCASPITVTDSAATTTTAAARFHTLSILAHRRRDEEDRFLCFFHCTYLSSPDRWNHLRRTKLHSLIFK